MVTFYCLDIEVFRLLAKVGVNGAPITVDRTGEGLSTTRPINEWIMPEGNTFTATLDKPPEDEGKQPEGGEPRLKASVFRADPDSKTPKPAEVLGSLKWTTQDEDLPLERSEPIEIKEPPPTRLWREAERIEALSDVDRSAMLKLIERFREALLDGRYDEAVKLTEYKLDDDARANGNDPAARRGAALRQYRKFLGQEKRDAQPLTRDVATFDIVADNRVVYVGHAEQDEALVVKTARLGMRFRLYFSKIGGLWRIVR